MEAATTYYGIADRIPDRPDCRNSLELVMISLSLTLWTFATFYLLLLLIYHLRSKQYFTVYDKCTWRTGHFRYDFHIVAGRHSSNYMRLDAMIILDLLDNQMVPTMSIQIPGQTLFNEQQLFVYKHSRPDLRCVNFTVYRKHPIRDVRCIRIAHSCPNSESRIFIYGVDLYDHTNGENRFFPILSVVKNRGTQWALMSTFEPKPDMSFRKIGVDCYDPFGYSHWPTYLEILTLIFFIWATNFCLGHFLSIKLLLGNIPLYSLCLFTISSALAASLSVIYLRFIKSHIIDIHFDTFCWMACQVIYLFGMILVSLAFWALASSQSLRCRRDSVHWLISTVASSLAATLILILGWCFMHWRRSVADKAALTETDSNLAKTNSRDNLQFVPDPVPNVCTQLFVAQASKTDSQGRQERANKVHGQQQQNEPPKNLRTNSSGNKKRKPEDKQQMQQPLKPDEETLDTAFGHGSKYMRAKNRNSISHLMSFRLRYDSLLMNWLCSG